MMKIFHFQRPKTINRKKLFSGRQFRKSRFGKVLEKIKKLSVRFWRKMRGNEKTEGGKVGGGRESKECKNKLLQTQHKIFFQFSRIKVCI